MIESSSVINETCTTSRLLVAVVGQKNRFDVVSEFTKKNVVIKNPAL